MNGRLGRRESREWKEVRAVSTRKGKGNVLSSRRREKASYRSNKKANLKTLVGAVDPLKKTGSVIFILLSIFPFLYTGCMKIIKHNKFFKHIPSLCSV